MVGQGYAYVLLNPLSAHQSKGTTGASTHVVWTMYVDLWTKYYKHLTVLDKRIGALTEEIPAGQWVQTIPSTGKTIAATIMAEIGEIDRFSHPKKLAAFAGVDPPVLASGKYTATFNAITKRGSRTLCHALFGGVAWTPPLGQPAAQSLP